MIVSDDRSHSKHVSVVKRVDQYSAEEKSDTVDRGVRSVDGFAVCCTAVCIAVARG